jgi:hypothetical protein
MPVLELDPFPQLGERHHEVFAICGPLSVLRVPGVDVRVSRHVEGLSK